MMIEGSFFLSGKFIFYCVTFLIFISSVIALFYKPIEFERTRLRLFLSILASAAVLLIGISLIFSSITFEYTRHFNQVSKTKEMADKLWLYPNQVLASSTHARPSFLASFQTSNPQLFVFFKQKQTAPLSTETILEEQNIAIIFIQIWEDYLTLRKFQTTGNDESWLNIFLQWAQSPYLREYFNRLEYSYNYTTIQFGKLLFEYAAKLPMPTTDPQQYYNASLQLMKDERLLQIYDK